MPIDRTTPFNDLPELLRPEELQAYLGISRAKTYELLRRGELPVIRLGRLLRVPKTAIAVEAV